MTEFEIYKEALLKGCSLESGRVSICFLDDYYPYRPMVKPNQWQVHCEAGPKTSSELYNDIDIAVEEFIKLKKKNHDSKR